MRMGFIFGKFKICHAAKTAQPPSNRIPSTVEPKKEEAATIAPPVTPNIKFFISSTFRSGNGLTYHR